MHFISPADIKLSSLNGVTWTHTCLLLRSLTNSEHMSKGSEVVLTRALSILMISIICCVCVCVCTANIRTQFAVYLLILFMVFRDKYIFFCIASTFNGNIRKLSYSQRLKITYVSHVLDAFKFLHLTGMCYYLKYILVYNMK